MGLFVKLAPKKDVHGRTALHLAALGGACVDTLSILLRAGVPVNIEAKADGETVLHIIARCGTLDCATMLMENGASATVENNNSLTPLDVAEARDQQERAKHPYEGGKIAKILGRKKWKKEI